MINAELDILLLHLIRIPELRQQALDRLGANNMFSELMTPVHYYAWESIQTLCDSDIETPISREVLETDTNIRLSNLDDYRDYAGETTTLMDFCYSTPEDQLSVSIGSKYLEVAALEKAKKEMLERVDQIVSAADVDSYINDVKHIYTPKSTTSTLMQPFMDIEQHLNEAPKLLTGMEPLDIISGGMSIGTVNGLLGPTGGGKTMSSIQILTEQGKRQQNCLLMLYEQPVGGDVAQRISSRMLGVPIEEVRKPFKQWPLEYQQRYPELRDRYAAYMHIKDMTASGQGCRGLADIADARQQLADIGHAPVYIIVDWFLPMIKRYLASASIAPSGENIRSFGYDFLDQAGQFARDNDVIMIVTHQLDTQTSRASPRRKPVVTDAMELKSFAFNIDSCFLLGNRDKETNIAWMLSDKNRRGAPSEMLVRMNGAMAQFEPAANYVADHKGSFIKADEINAMPKEEAAPDGSMASGYM
jgi:hypothetical protein